MIRAGNRPDPRRVFCSRCGAAFECGGNGDCWCADEAARLPMPAAPDEDCLCPACLRHRAVTNTP